MHDTYVSVGSVSCFTHPPEQRCDLPLKERCTASYDDGANGIIRHQSKHGREEEQHKHDNDGCDHTGQLGLRTRRVVHG